MKTGSHCALGVLLTLVLSMPATPAGAVTPAGQVMSACERGMFNLDCRCVAAEFEKAAAGASSSEQAALTAVVSVISGLEPDQANMDLMAFAHLGPGLNILENLTDQCASDATTASAPAAYQGDARASATPTGDTPQTISASASLGKVLAACRESDFELDCGCVGERFQLLVSEGRAGDRDALARFAVAGMGGENRVSELPLPVLERVAERGSALMPDALFDDCPPAATPPSAPLPASSPKGIVPACREGGLPLDCQCVAGRFDAAVKGLPASGRAYAAAVAATALHGTSALALADFPAQTALKYVEVADLLSDPEAGLLAPSCIDATDPALLAARVAGERSAGLPAGDLAARAAVADWREAVRMKCQAFGNTSAFCGCRAELYAQDLSDEESRLLGEMIRRSAQYSLGRIGHEAVNAERVAKDLGYASDEIRTVLNRIQSVRNSDRLATRAYLVCRTFIAE